VVCRRDDLKSSELETVLADFQPHSLSKEVDDAEFFRPFPEDPGTGRNHFRAKAAASSSLKHPKDPPTNQKRSFLN